LFDLRKQRLLFETIMNALVSQIRLVRSEGPIKVGEERPVAALVTFQRRSSGADCFHCRKELHPIWSGVEIEQTRRASPHLPSYRLTVIPVEADTKAQGRLDL